MTPREFHAWLWLDLAARGWSTRRIAERFSVALRTVQVAIREVRAQLDSCRQHRDQLVPPPLAVFYGCRPLVPSSTCNHDRIPVPRGDHQCCGICHRSGLDHLPYFRLVPGIDQCPAPRPGTGSRPSRSRPS